ncbi:fumarylacetoacetate hydrolase family protein [Micromonospora globispora]|uniref:fumarylacetoacetate hydrolase family protein n=1 Tax=Micromonospora globispora TaxID=1450148 RepID=UPI000F5E1AE0|nr:fumarylacetoacetate hydrolase family protein [Micromonospora globispora]RQW88477.1 fumarylacetoacetate hydrolase [Micromonospora globispora]
MRFANIGGRLAISTGGGYADVAAASGGQFGPAAMEGLENWSGLRAWADRQDAAALEPYLLEGSGEKGTVDLRIPVPEPRQVFAIGLNYRDHVAESGLTEPSTPPVFTKFPTCLTGPRDSVVLPPGSVDWEVELVVVIGRRGEHVSEGAAWSHVAGVMVGQDLSERQLQLAGPAPQFSLGKSFPGFGPIGPVLVTVDELADPDDLALGCRLEDGDVLQSGRTRDLIFPVPELIARLSAVCPLLPGDLIFTGTPAGVGGGRKPPRFLRPGDVLVSWVEGVGTLRNRMVAAPAAAADQHSVQVLELTHTTH